MIISENMKVWGGALEESAPRNVEELRVWVEGLCGLKLPERGVCAGHCSPLEYLAHAFSEDGAGDCVVWACRGGGKTQLGAVATLLDLIYKPGIQVRILGGSLEQSGKMYEHLRRLMQRPRFAGLLEGKLTRRGFSLVNGSRVEMLAQAGTAVRGQRVQKLRCDEVELFDPDVWQAAQLATRSVRSGGGSGRKADGGVGTTGVGTTGVGCGRKADGGVGTTGVGTTGGRSGGGHGRARRRRRGGEGARGFAIGTAIEAVSTMHVPGGLMQKLVEQSPQLGRKVFAWCMMDVIENCPEEARKCEGCALEKECGGRARDADGFMKVEDLIAMKGRVSPMVWEREMLCLPPRFDDAVFGGFSRGRHVRGFEPGADWGSIEGADVEWFCGVDFGFAGAFVCLWIAIERDRGCRGDRRVWVWDELVVRRQTLGECIQEMKRRGPGMENIVRVGCDSAGAATNSQTNLSDMRVLREAGYAVSGCTRAVAEGIERLRALLGAADGGVRLTVHPRCVRLAAAFEGYRVEEGTGRPVKDGVHDHLIDALRYGVTGGMATGVRMRMY